MPNLFQDLPTGSRPAEKIESILDRPGIVGWAKRSVPTRISARHRALSRVGTAYRSLPTLRSVVPAFPPSVRFSHSAPARA